MPDNRPHEPKRFYLLSGMVYCAECNRVYITQTQPAGKNKRKTDGQSYRHRTKEGHCTNRQIAARPLELDTWGTVAAAILDPDNLRKGYADQLQQDETRRKRLVGHLETLHRTLAKLEGQRDNLTRAYIDPEIGMSKAEYLKQKAGLEGEWAPWRARLPRRKTTWRRPTARGSGNLRAFTEEIRAALREHVRPGPEPEAQGVENDAR